MDLERPPAAKRIKEAREKAGLSPEKVAEIVGLSIAAYDDLEEDDDEAFMCVSLGQLRSLAEILLIKPMQVVEKNIDYRNQEVITVTQLAERIRENIKYNSEDVESFGERVGWDVSSALEDPNNIWKDWNLDGLQDICNAVGVNWENVLNS